MPLHCVANGLGIEGLESFSEAMDMIRRQIMETDCGDVIEQILIAGELQWQTSQQILPGKIKRISLRAPFEEFLKAFPQNRQCLGKRITTDMGFHLKAPASRPGRESGCAAVGKAALTAHPAGEYRGQPGAAEDMATEMEGEVVLMPLRGGRLSNRDMRLLGVEGNPHKPRPGTSAGQRECRCRFS